MRNLINTFIADEQGAETVEWVVIVALLVTVAIAIYQGILQADLTTAINNIGTKIKAL